MSNFDKSGNVVIENAQVIDSSGRPVVQGSPVVGQPVAGSYNQPQPAYGYGSPQPQAYGQSNYQTQNSNVVVMMDHNIYGDTPPGQILSEDVDIAVRHGFVRKVFGLLFIQLAVTCLICAPFVAYQEEMYGYISTNRWLYTAAFGGLIGCMFIMCCCGHIMRKFPNNYIFLGVFTVCFGVLTGISTFAFDSYSVLIAAGICVGLTFGLVCFAWQTKYDFTGAGPYLFGALLCLILFGMLAGIFSSRSSVPTVHVVYAGLGSLIFCFYIIYDTQLIIGGKHKKCQYGVDEYVFAALSLYIDVMQLFLMILTLVGDRG